MASLRYLTPFVFLALLPLGGWFGGAWAFSAAVATVLFMPGLDIALGEHEQFGRQDHTLMDWLPGIYILGQLSMNAWMALIVSRPEIRLLTAIGLALSAGFTTGVFGFVAAHAMIHSHHNRARSLGLTMFASTFYMHFRIAHLIGHHRRAATDDDPASARLGEGLYSFLVRSVTGQVREAWDFEVERLRRRGRGVLDARNRMSVYFAVEATLVITLAALSRRAFVFAVATAVIAVGLLETFNYVAHYGLRRRIGIDGRTERLTPRHSWNSKARMDCSALFNIGCHSDHHCHPSRSFEELTAVSGGAILPFGYGTALLTALVPAIWRKVMDKRAIAVMAEKQ